MMNKNLPTLVLSITLWIIALIIVPTSYAAMECQNITISPDQTTFSGGETITITVSGTPGQTNSIDLYWKPAYMPMNQNANWTQINGIYNATNKTFTANWVIPSTPAEILLAANNFNAQGNFCSGNPGFLSCTTGIYFFGGLPQSCCSGCQKKIVVDPLKNLTADTGIDTAPYFRFDPGNYWQYSGTNYSYPQGDQFRTFTSRIEVEKPVNLCGHPSVPLRFMKDKKSGYISPQMSYQPQSRWAGPWALRFWSSGFYPDTKWNNRFLASLGGILYETLPSPNQLKGIGDFDVTTKGVGYYTSGSQHFYYPPYLFAPRFLPTNPTSWSFIRQDEIFAPYDLNPAIQNSFCRYETDQTYTNNYNNRGHGWEVAYGWENITTPVFNGQALRLRFLEYNMSDNPGDVFLLREDWYLGPTLGLVKLTQKNLERLGLNRATCDSECANTPMQNPEIDMVATHAYFGQPLTVSGSSAWVPPGSSWTLNFSNNYTGYLDIQWTRINPDGTTANGESIWSNADGSPQWVENGSIINTVQPNISPGQWTLKFRRHIPQPTNAQKAADETVDATFTNPFAWSNPLTVYFTPNPPPTTTPPAPTPTIPTTPTTPPFPPGDVNHDNQVNLVDYSLLTTNFNANYPAADFNQNGVVDIFDFNLLVSNFGH